MRRSQAEAEVGNKVMTSATTARLAPKVLRGAVYRVDRSSGITEYTNVRPRDGRFAVLFTYISTCVACDLHSTINFARTALNLDAYKDEVASAAADSGVDAALLRAVIHAESAFNPMAISSKGAQGLMQLMPGTATDLGVDRRLRCRAEIRGGAQYLARMLKNFNGDERLADGGLQCRPGGGAEICRCAAVCRNPGLRRARGDPARSLPQGAREPARGPWQDRIRCRA